MITEADIQYLYNLIMDPKLNSNIPKKHKLISEFLRSKGFIKFGAGTNRLVFRYVNNSRILLKVAVDKVGLTDSLREYYNQEKLKPFVVKIFDVHPTGIVACVERVTPITSHKTFALLAEDYYTIMTKFFIGKYVMDDIAFDDQASNYNDVPYARYAEVLLNYAEAKAELGTLTDDDWSRTIGALRRRAGITGGDLDTRPVTADPYMQSIYSGVTDPVILEIRRERECELVLEGLRLNDLKRWACGHLWQDALWDGIYIPALDTPLDLNGDGVNDVYVTENDAYGGEYNGIAMKMGDNQKVVAIDDDPDGGYRLDYKASRVWRDNMYIYPVPEVVIQKNTSLHQNPGWN